MTDKIKRGKQGEELAAEFLVQNGYRILERNYRYKHSEIDLIAEKGNWLVFVEVKTRSSHAFGFPEEFVDDKQVDKILEGADNYMYENNWKGNVRYDIIAVDLGDDRPQIQHFEDAFH